MSDQSNNDGKSQAGPRRPDEESLRADGVSHDVFRHIYAKAAPWDIGRAQQVVVDLAREGYFRGDILDAGCGTGDNAIHLASLDHDVVGVDFVSEAIEVAKRKAVGRNLTVDFRVHDARELGELNRTFDTVLDCGLFHVFSDRDRPLYVESLASVTRPDGRLHLMCFAESETREGGPRRVTQAELRSAFAGGWREQDIRPIRFEATIYDDGARAWLATFIRA